MIEITETGFDANLKKGGKTRPSKKDKRDSFIIIGKLTLNRRSDKK
jgi:hypothetical protein